MESQMMANCAGLWILQMFYSICAFCWFVPQPYSSVFKNIYIQGYQNFAPGEIVNIKVYYESLCPGCRYEFNEELAPLVSRLSDHIDVQIYPYGHAKTSYSYGDYSFTSQHGPAETYGNKLHSCAVTLLQNETAAVLFNACMMESSRGQGSDDEAADYCGLYYSVNSNWIKQCAKSRFGSSLLKQMGDATSQVHLEAVPTVFINGRKASIRNLFHQTCDAFSYPPLACRT